MVRSEYGTGITLLIDIDAIALIAYLRSLGYTDIFAIKNNSGHGIDIVATDPHGNPAFFEVKATQTGRAGGLSSLQRRGGQDYVGRQLLRAIAAKGHWSVNNTEPGAGAQTETALQNLERATKEGRPITYSKINVFTVAPGASGPTTLTTSPW